MDMPLCGGSLQHGLASGRQSWVVLWGSGARVPGMMATHGHSAPSAAVGHIGKGCLQGCCGTVRQFGVTWARATAAGPGDVPCTGRPEACWHPSIHMMLLNSWPPCYWHVILPASGKQHWWKHLFLMKDRHSCAYSSVCNESPTTNKALKLHLHKLTWFQLCQAHGSLQSSTLLSCSRAVSFWDSFPCN